MTAPRRRILRPLPKPVNDPRQTQRLQAWRSKLESERKSFDRWLTRLKRAFHAVEKQQRRISRLERLITQAE